MERGHPPHTGKTDYSLPFAAGKLPCGHFQNLVAGIMAITPHSKPRWPIFGFLIHKKLDELEIGPFPSI